MSTNTSAHAGSALCQDCGICCTGAIFEHVSFNNNELRHLKVDPVKKTDKQKQALPHPCQFLEGPSCGIYPDRPSNCRAYSCETRRQVLNGELSLDEGQRIVTELKELFDQLYPLADKLLGADLKQVGFRAFCRKFLSRMERKISDGVLPDTAERETIQLCFEAIKLIDRHFRKTSRLGSFAQLIMSVDYLEKTQDPD